jgi:hypothetical protein
VIAKNSGAPVWPIFIQTSSPYLSKGWTIWRLPPRKIRLRPYRWVSRCSIHQRWIHMPFLETLRQRYIDAECGVKREV